MADDPPIFPSSDLEDDVVSTSDDDDDEDQQPPLNFVVSPSFTTAVTTTTPLPAQPPPPPYTSLTIALSANTTSTTSLERKPIDDSRRLFQRLWTDEDEIELLQGYLHYITSRALNASCHHHDTTAFYDQIKNKLQLEFNKNQLVEKLRRLKKKYRNVISKRRFGKDFVFKSPHDHATFEISRKIWSNLSAGVEFDDADHNPYPNPNSSYNAVTIATPTRRPSSSNFIVGHINLNSGSSGGGGTSGGGGGGVTKLSTRKRLRESGKVEDKFVKVDGGIINKNHAASISNNNNVISITTNNNTNVNAVQNDYMKNVGVSTPLQGLVEETIKTCLSPVLKDLINNAVKGGKITSPSGGGGSPGFKGVGALVLNAMPLNFPEVNVEGGMDEKWRKQQIMELEVYSKRLELVQDQIKLSLEELRSMD